jgi:hypothetical protein
LVGSVVDQPTPDQSYPAPTKLGFALGTGLEGKPLENRSFVVGE